MMTKLIDISTEDVFNLFETTMSTRVGNFLHDDGAWADSNFDRYMVEHQIKTEFKLIPEDEQPTHIYIDDDHVLQRPYDPDALGLPKNLVGGYLKGVMYDLHSRPIVVDNPWQTVDDKFLDELRKLHPFAERIFIIDEVHFEKNFERALDIATLLYPILYTFPKFVACVVNSVYVPDLTDGSYTTHENFFIIDDMYEDGGVFLPAVRKAEPSPSTVFSIGSDIPISPKLTARPSLLLDEAFDENDTKIGRDKFWKMGFNAPRFAEIAEFASSSEASEKYDAATIREIMSSDLIAAIHDNDTTPAPPSLRSFTNFNECIFTAEDIFDISCHDFGDFYVDTDVSGGHGLRLEIVSDDKPSCSEIDMFGLSVEGGFSFLTKDTSSYCTTMEVAHAIGIEKFSAGPRGGYGWALGTNGSKMPVAIDKVRGFCAPNEALVWLLLMSWVDHRRGESDNDYFSVDRAMLGFNSAKSLSHSMDAGRALEFLRAGAQDINEVIELVDNSVDTEEALTMLRRGMTIQQIVNAIHNGIDVDLMGQLTA